MIKISLTGSIGMGKSTVASMFADAGIPGFDADAEVRAMQGPGGSLVDPIGKRFPGTVRDGVLDRALLRQTVLEDPEALTALEAIVHPAVQAAREAFVENHRDAPALLFEIPLLFETGGESAFDKVIVVTAPGDVQRARVLQRQGITKDALDAILERQLPDSEKRDRADFVINTGGDLSTTKRQVDDIIACLGLAADS